MICGPNYFIEGKSPVFVDTRGDLTVAARRIAWGKYCNCGQVSKLSLKCTHWAGNRPVCRYAFRQTMSLYLLILKTSLLKHTRKRSSPLSLFVIFTSQITNTTSTSSFFPSGARSSDSYNRIVSIQHHKRLQKLLGSTNGTVVFGGLSECDEDAKYFPPTLVKDVKGDDSLMQEEIFGPILPVLAVKDLDEAIAFVRGR